MRDRIELSTRKAHFSVVRVPLSLNVPNCRLPKPTKATWPPPKNAKAPFATASRTILEMRLIRSLIWLVAISALFSTSPAFAQEPDEVETVVDLRLPEVLSVEIIQSENDQLDRMHKHATIADLTAKLEEISSSLSAISAEIEREHDKFDWMQIVLTAVSIASAVAALFAARTASQMPQIENRAYCLARNPRLTFHKNYLRPGMPRDPSDRGTDSLARFTAKLPVENIGKTLAFGVQVQARLCLKSSAPIDDDKLNIIGDMQVFIPAAYDEFTCDLEDGKLTPEQYTPRHEAGELLWLVGQVTYSDIFKKKWRMSFCYSTSIAPNQVNGDTDFKAHSTGNSIDQIN